MSCILPHQRETIFISLSRETFILYSIVSNEKNEVSEVIKCFRIRMTLFPMVSVAKSDYGGKFSEKLTKV